MTLIGEDTVIAVVDPVRVADRRLILDPIARLDIRPEDVTDVVFCHHPPDHTLNAALFPQARVHDHWAIYSGGRWEDRDADGLELTPAVRLMRTPGHTTEDITTLARTDHGLAAATHLRWNADGPEDDPLAEDAKQLKQIVGARLQYRQPRRNRKPAVPNPTGRLIIEHTAWLKAPPEVEPSPPRRRRT